jgi:hypothetical protein
MATSISGTRTPWHLWLAGIVGLLWNGFGVADYVQTKMGGAQYLRDFGLSEAQIAYTLAMPAWVTGVWAVGVFSALIGTVLLFLRHRLAAPLFLVSLGAYLLSLVYSWGLSNGREVMGDMWWMQFVVLAGCLFFAWYSNAMAKAGVLR